MADELWDFCFESTDENEGGQSKERKEHSPTTSDNRQSLSNVNRNDSIESVHDERRLSADADECWRRGQTDVVVSTSEAPLKRPKRPTKAQRLEALSKIVRPNVSVLTPKPQLKRREKPDITSQINRNEYRGPLERLHLCAINRCKVAIKVRCFL